MGRLSFIIIVGPNCDHKVLVIGRQRRITHTQRSGEGNVMIQTEIGAMWSLAKDCQQPPEAGRRKG